MKEKYRIAVTCWDYDCKKPYMESSGTIFDNFDEAFKYIEECANDELISLNDIETDTPREKVAIEDCDGSIIGYDYPFRADFDGDNHCIVRFWDGEDYQNVTAYNIHKVEDWDGYYVYRGFEIYPNRNKNRFRIESYSGYIKLMKYKLESAFNWIDEWELSRRRLN